MQRRQAACEEVEELRGQIAQLTGRLAGVEERLSGGLVLVRSPIFCPVSALSRIERFST